MDKDFNRRAEALIREGQLDEARILLEESVERQPGKWRPIQERTECIQGAFWDEEEFFAYVMPQQKALTKSIFWVPGSYSKAWYLLALIGSKQGRLEHALFCVDCGLELEPDHPDLWSHKGVVLGKFKRHGEALECYIRAATARNWAPPAQVARALRGQGVQLIDLERLDEAEAALRQSLELEPESKIARQELDLIEQLRGERAKEKKKLLWFVDAIMHPPTDPLTVQLLQLVDGLPSIPGPQTVGAENYSEILDAFLERGWAGFEEEFDRIIPRNRRDYEQVKRDLLRESVFSLKAQRNLTRGFMAQIGASDETLEDVFNDIFGDHEEPDPQ
jgi:tetratricopeptide (TPR) repeat protein